MLDNQENTQFVQHIFNIVKQSKTELAIALGINVQDIDKFWTEEMEDLEITSRKYLQGKPILNEAESQELEEAFQAHRLAIHQTDNLGAQELSEALENSSPEPGDLEEVNLPNAYMAPSPAFSHQVLIDRIGQFFMHPQSGFVQEVFPREGHQLFGNEPLDLVLYHQTPPFYVLIRVHSEPIDNQAPKRLEPVLEYYHSEVNNARTLSPVGIILGKHRHEWVIGYIYQPAMKSIVERYLPSKEALKEIIENMG